MSSESSSLHDSESDLLGSRASTVTAPLGRANSLRGGGEWARIVSYEHRQRAPAASHAGSHHAHVASGRHDQDGGEEEKHRKRNAVEKTARAVEGFHAARDVN